MQKKILSFFFKNSKILGLIFLIIFTIAIVTLSNQQKKVNKNQILPLLTQPYTGLKKIDILCGYKTINKNQIIKIVRADGDADRPSL